MKRIIAISALLVSASALGQVSNPSIVQRATAPTVCQTLPLYVLGTNGDLYGGDGTGACKVLATPGSAPGTVTAVTVTPANGVSATVVNQGTTPALTFVLGAIAPTSTNGVSAATMAFMDATSSVQTQLNGKSPLASPAFTGVVKIGDGSTGITGASEIFQFGNGTLNNTGGTLNATTFNVGNGASGEFGGSYVALTSTGSYQFSATANALGGTDTILCRSAAGVLEVGNSGSCGAGGIVKATGFQIGGTIYSVAGTALPSCAAGTLLQRLAVSDATLATPGSTYAGSGTYTISVQCIYNSTGPAYTWIID